MQQVHFPLLLCSAHDSPLAHAMAKWERVLEAIYVISTSQAMTEQLYKVLQEELLKLLLASMDSGGTVPEEPPQPPSRMEVQDQLGLLAAKLWLQGRGVELPWGLLDTDNAMRGVKERSKNMAPHMSRPTKSGSSSPVDLGSTIPEALGRSSPAQPSPQQQVPAGRTSAWVAPGLCRVGRCLREGCARLWQRLKAWWQWCLQSCSSCIRKFLK